jgi:hypothetical protein
LAQLDLEENRLIEAQEGFEESLRLARALNWHRAIAYCLHWLGDTARKRGDFGAASSYLSESRTYLERFHDRARLAMLTKSEALLALAVGDQYSAQRLGADASDEMQRMGLWYELRELNEALSLTGTHLVD